MKPVDLRSDTVTQPTAEMREVRARANTICGMPASLATAIP